MFREEFIDLNRFANLKWQEKFAINSKPEPNPYYLGFGNPNADILIIGQEMAIDPIKKPEALEMESFRNTEHWNHIIEEKITDPDYSFSGKNGFKNPRRPYTGKAKGTWKSYEDIIQKSTGQKFEKNLEFFEHCFITEINTAVSKRQKGYLNSEERNSIITHEFYKSFSTVILATGSYLRKKEINELFEVHHSVNDSASKPYKRLEVYYSQNKKRTLINTRQLSNFRFTAEERNEYFQRIADKIN
ncbi:hypothetical protein RM549_17420 [Salegentibacter sp. F188]|uniref:Uncharacterized protein n=1 Tax=Autumnicola patrickiae TaxID=3075591 RepID=A0ABU3E6J6_9FLAO|nr:hypothetical protein [Salegentibacter sp. F188]MDT0691575.1 hypothetical protein [Salegentibacter sp. F188]